MTCYIGTHVYVRLISNSASLETIKGIVENDDFIREATILFGMQDEPKWLLHTWQVFTSPSSGQYYINRLAQNHCRDPIIRALGLDAKAFSILEFR